MSEAEDSNKRVPDRVRLVRKELGLTQEELAEKLNVTSKYISMIETGRKPMTHKLAKTIVELAGYPTRIDWLMGISDHRTENELLIRRIEGKEESFAAFMVMLSDAMKESGVQLYSNGLKEFFSDFPEDVINNVPLHALPNMCTFKLKREDKTVTISGKKLTRLHRHLTRYLKTLIEEMLEEGDADDGEQ